MPDDPLHLLPMQGLKAMCAAQERYLPDISSLPLVRLEGIDVHAITEAECVRYVISALSRGCGGVVATVNLDYLRRIRTSVEFKDLCEEATLCVADGMPLVWASWILGKRLPGRVAGSDLVDDLTGAAAEAGFSVFFLGGNPGAAEEAARILGERYERLRIAGVNCPPVGFENSGEEMERIRHALTDGKPGVVYVALGSPKQDWLIKQLRSEFPSVWWVGVGISFSFVTGEVKRAPRVLRRLGMEWVHRLSQEPRRLARRYLLEGMPYALSLFGRALISRVAGRDSIL